MSTLLLILNTNTLPVPSFPLPVSLPVKRIEYSGDGADRYLFQMHISLSLCTQPRVHAYLMESQSSSLCDTCCSYSPQVELSLSSRGKCSLCSLFDTNVYWGNAIYGMWASSLSFSMENHASSPYFPHLPMFPKTALEWNLYFILSPLCTMGTAA